MLVNGRTTDQISIEDRGLLYGDGLFETILCEQGEPVLFSEHMQRLQSGCERLNIYQPDTELILVELKEVARQTDCIIKVIITRGARGRGYQYDASDTRSTRIIYRSELPDIPIQHYTSGIRLYLCRHKLPDNTALAGIKHLNRLDQVLARGEWTQGYDEGIMLDYRGNVIEGTMSNVFIQSKGKWLTPNIDCNGVEGVMRNYILQCVNELSIECEQLHIPLSCLQNAEAVFVCNSVIGIWPVVSFNTQHYEIADDTRRVMQFLHDNVSPIYKLG